MDIEAILDNMTLEEKIALCSGANFWQTKAFEHLGVPQLFMSDGPHGLRKQENEADMLGVNNSRPSTCFPAEVTTSATWDIALLERIGAAVGEEARHQGVGLVLGPGANIKRNPLCGRNFEYFSEDPFLTGKLAAAFIRGVESQGVGTSLKHFAGNSQELKRFTSDSVMDERTLRELYLTGFEIAVKEGNPATLMCAYPKLNGTHCSDNKTLLTGILRDDWGFPGAVVTDWGAMNDRIAAFEAGCDLSMPGGAAYMECEVAQAVRSGELSEAKVDACARRVLALVERGVAAMTGEDCDYGAHHALCEEAALSGAVLLQNTDNLLPLHAGAKVAVVGALAKSMRYQGAGSSHINATQLVHPFSCMNECAFATGCDDAGATTDALLEEASEVARSADVVVVFAGLPDSYESEGFDRESMKMPDGHVRMIEAVAAANENTVVVLMCGSAVECPWAAHVKSILYMGLPGQAGGQAIAKLLYGEVVPSGRLTETWPVSYEDVPSSECYGRTTDALYEEGLYVGYRYYDKAAVPVQWAFGFGLSYSRFEYSNLMVSGKTVSVDVCNAGKYDAAEVVQLFIGAPQDGLHRPLRELKGFQKVWLKQGECATVHFELNDRSFALWDDGWVVPKGVYEIQIGSLSAALEVAGKVVAAPEWQAGSFYETCQGKPAQAEWEQMLERAYVPTPKACKGSYTMESTVEEMRADSLVMKIMYAFIALACKKISGTSDPDDPEYKMMLAAAAGGPLRSSYISSGVSGGIFPGLLELANGHYLRGIKRMLLG